MVRSERRGATLLITLDRPERRNALDHEAVQHLGAALSEDDDARIVVLTGEGGHFCSGADISTVESDDYRRDLRVMLDAIRARAVPVLAAVEGSCLGAGFQVAGACDLRVAAPDAVFGVPAARLGVMVDHWTVRRVAEAVGPSMARAVLLGAETIDAERAHALGLAHRLGDLEGAMAWADEIAALAPLSHAGHKHSLNALDPTDPAAEDPDAALAGVWASADLAEGIAAFGDRRRPAFEGR